MNKYVSTTRLTALGLTTAALLMAGLVAGCSEYRVAGREVAEAEADAERLPIEQTAERVVERFEQQDPTLATLLEEAHGYAVFPEVTKGGAVIGGAHGEGAVYEQGQLVGYATLTQGTVGPQLGGQVYSQIIAFEDEWAMDNFKRGDLEFAAQASAVAATEGAAAGADYDQGVAVFTMPRTGLMFEAAIGGQQFTFEPVIED